MFTRPTRIATLSALTLVVATIGVTPFAHPTVNAGGGGTDRPIICEDSLCVLAVNPIVDTDGDGVSDVDEIAAGTDPADPASRPSVLQLIDLVSISELPSFERRFTEVIALPTTAPNGHSLVSNLPAGAMSSTVSKGLEHLGLSASLMSSYGINAISGVRISADPGALLGQSFGASSNRFVGGMNMALVSAGDDVLTPLGRNFAPSEALRKLSPNQGEAPASAPTSSTGRDGSTTWSQVYKDGSSDTQQSKGGKTTQTSVDAEVRLQGTGMSTAAPGKTNPDGSHTTGSNSTTHDERGTTATSGTTKTTKSDGSSVTQTATVYVRSYDGGQTTSATTVVTVTSVDPKGNTTTTTATRECSTSCTTTTKDTTTTTKEYINPDADNGVVWLTPDDVAKIVRVATGADTTPGPAAETIVLEDGWAPASPWSMIALVDDTMDTTTIFVEPRMPKTAPGSDPYLNELIGAIGSGGCVQCPKP